VVADSHTDRDTCDTHGNADCDTHGTADCDTHGTADCDSYGFANPNPNPNTRAGCIPSTCYWRNWAVIPQQAAAGQETETESDEPKFEVTSMVMSRRLCVDRKGKLRSGNCRQYAFG
jgi:hypothetical protein